MSSSDDQPSIPRRPNKSSKKTYNANESSDSGEIESLLVEPLVPKRPNRSSDFTDESKDLSFTTTSNSSIPEIPSRPGRGEPVSTDKKAQIQESAPMTQAADGVIPSILSPVIGPITGDDYQSQESNAEPLRENIFRHSEEEASGRNITEFIAPSVQIPLRREGTTTSTVDDSVLNSMKIDEPVISGDGDGDKTPGNSNTKITFKDEDDNNSNIGSDASSFNDDVETVSQEKDDNELNCRQVESTNPNVERERNQNSSRSVEILSLQTSNLEHSKKDIDDQTVHHIHEKADEKDNVQQLGTGNPMKKPPLVPRRPKSSEIQIEMEAKLSVPDLNHGSIVTHEEESGTDTGNNSCTFEQQRSSIAVKSPIVPSRPKKTINTTGQEESNKSRAPPPKPKKLGSRIAAFQQMLIQEPQPPQVVSTGEPNPPQPFNKKLSSDKMKFAESLRGVVGKGVALPGLANPNMVPMEKPLPEKENSRDYSAEPIKTKNDRRLRGPKGKRLPKSLQEPVRIESESRFKMASYDLWEVNLSTRSIKAIESNETKDGTKGVLSNIGTYGYDNSPEYTRIDSEGSNGEEIGETIVSVDEEVNASNIEDEEIPSKSSVLKGSDKEEPSSINDDYVSIEKSSSLGEEQVDNAMDRGLHKYLN